MKIYSHSMVSTYENCPHQFKLKYIEKPEIEKIDGIEAFLGKRVHETLEKLHKELILSKQNSLDELLEFYKSSWAKNYKENIVIRKKDTAPKIIMIQGKGDKRLLQAVLSV